MALISMDEALKRLLEATPVLPDEMVSLEEALGRALAQPVKALLTQPPFDSSAMDGYACRAEDISTLPCQLKLVGEAAAGHGFQGSVNKNEAIRILTGAPVPDCVDSIIIQENTNRLPGDIIEFLKPVKKGDNIRPRGGDFALGDTILPIGHVMTPASLALAAAAGHGKVHVFRRPRVAVLATGDELVPVGTLPGPDQIVASNTHGIAAILKLHGADTIDLGIATDDRASINAAIALAKSEKVDLLITSGGVSFGDYDLVQAVLKEQGMTLDFWKIAIRPGKPLMFGTLPDKTLPDKTLVVGLPGNPVSSLTTCQLFVVPMLEKLAGRQYHPDYRRATLTSALKANGDRRHFIRAVLTRRDNGSYHVTPAKSHDSSLLKIMAQSNCFIVNFENEAEKQAGEDCTIFVPHGGAL